MGLYTSNKVFVLFGSIPHPTIYIMMSPYNSVSASPAGTIPRRIQQNKKTPVLVSQEAS